ncbi:hypothetical protein K1T71_000404 [Dendrolimus kikuchii]|uniref:Uncharacterized protein n=1 Tax=Dendrolimus kikuchii TaxID=765133 RepID=A0ACC1DJH5_9NEOP|nr:hypothetical protein K1T71_000404 [Dendrolimus kikuchii]
MSQQYSLRWNNHQPNFISMFTSLLNTQTLVDVTLAAEGQQLQAHKVVLSACSTYFQALFVDNPSRHPIVILKDVTFADLRTMVDFMYYGEVNVTEQQLPKVLDTAKHLKIKGLTEMPDTASLRAQGTGADFQSPVDSADSQRHSASPASPVTKRKRRRKSSTGSTSLNMVIGEDNKEEKGSQTLDLVRGESITLSSVPQQRRVREYHDERTLDNMQQPTEPHNLNIDPMSIDTNAAGIPQEVKLRRSKLLKRQSRVNPEEKIEVRKQVSEPTPECAVHTLRKHESYPEYESKQVLFYGRILRRKTQYHCPECRTNLCIVPCFHEYHEGPESEANASAK